MPKYRYRLIAAAVLAAALPLAASRAADPRVQRGEYLVRIIGCGDCHTAARFSAILTLSTTSAGRMSASPSPIWACSSDRTSRRTMPPAWANGRWRRSSRRSPPRAARRRMLAPIMPWRGFSNLTPDDAQAVALFLKSLPPVSNSVPGPFGPHDTPSVLVMTIVPGEEYARLPKGP